ncbi:Glycosyl hydrolase family 20, domain 2 [Arenibacter nanhaiticus]|uniref:beta-N-acetylhexosaminidase n=1 Tax=Arenibacter nanhaiticus TaxID=558155 RepID=A0A1M6GB74_9FLAO|nr:family 20 glycosylhydrolase [Arenibacter nanhaiticus]SHJ07210.1 Glycosyl hydrolase family 20, domain 2 [Arenibacter nanhaiticus]
MKRNLKFSDEKKPPVKKKVAFQVLGTIYASLFLILTFTGYANQIINTSLEEKYPLIPTPQELEYGKKEVRFKSVYIKGNAFLNEGLSLAPFFTAEEIAISKKGLVVKLIKSDKFKASEKEEGYTLKIGKEVVITAYTPQGAFYGLQTFKQLLRKEQGQWMLPQIKIRDWPVFKIRGLLHDTGRNFQSVAQLKEQIDILALYKYNTFHWHLTDNPGWRLESKLYPQLQSDEAFSRGVGKYYTQEDFKEILAYCKARYITVIPEFDIPGHTDAFRRGLGIKTMKDERVLPILLDLFDELMGLAGEKEMPYVHIGTDEVRNEAEYVEDEMILAIMEHVKNKNREVIVWKEGIVIPEDSTSINQLWAYHEGRKGHRFIDSRSNYINHLDPFAGMARLFFQQPARQPKGDSLAMGGILGAWPDNNVLEERDILKQNPIYPSLVFYSEAIWRGKEKDYPEYWAKLPAKNTAEFMDFKEFEEKVLVHRELYFKDKEFPYIRQTDKFWKIIGPFDHEGDFAMKFPVEEEIKQTYEHDGKEYKWNDDAVGGTVHLKHFFNFPAFTEEKSGTYYAYTRIYAPDNRSQEFWIGFQGWSRSGGRRGGPTPKIGQWHFTEPQIWVNDQEIAPPVWQQPNLGSATDEIPFIDEDYFYRKPTLVALNKGWNTVLIKIPHGGNSWKWMFTCVPVEINGRNVREVKDLIFDASF